MLSGGKLTLGMNHEDPLFLLGDESAVHRGGAFATVEGTLVMNGGYINGFVTNQDVETAPIYVKPGGTFEMNGGRILGNAANLEGEQMNAGGVFVTQGEGDLPGGRFVMNGGSIDNNFAKSGGVFVGHSGDAQDHSSPAVFEMNGGSIVQNENVLREYFPDGPPMIGHYGGGVTVWNNGIFTMTDGVIGRNTAYYGGGVAMVDQNGDNTPTFIMDGGIIVANIVDGHIDTNNQLIGAVGPGVYLENANIESLKGHIIDNIIAVDDDGYPKFEGKADRFNYWKQWINKDGERIPESIILDVFLGGVYIDTLEVTEEAPFWFPWYNRSNILPTGGDLLHEQELFY